MADGSETFRGGWLREFNESVGWRGDIAAAYRLMQAPQLRILIWGPGSHWPEYSKRRTLLQFLCELGPADEVSTSEELLTDLPAPPGITEYQVEEVHWRTADLVFAIIARDGRISGSRVEIARWGDDPDFVSRSFLISPRLSPKERRSQSFLNMGWRNFPPERKFEYTEREYDDCTHIRAYCANAVQRLRALRGFQQWRQLFR